jgi:quinoprotein glucose dehydrogenase
LIGGGNKFRAIDKKTGAMIYETELSGAITGGPMTYMANGRQFIVMAVGGREGHEFVALALPVAGRGPARAKPVPGN